MPRKSNNTGSGKKNTNSGSSTSDNYNNCLVNDSCGNEMVEKLNNKKNHRIAKKLRAMINENYRKCNN